MLIFGCVFCKIFRFNFHYLNFSFNFCSHYSSILHNLETTTFYQNYSRFYWSVHDLYDQVIEGQVPANSRVNGQLIWRDYFYTMSVNNPYYGEMERNPICLDIPWQKNDAHLKAWKDGKTGYPFIDAVMRQLKAVRTFDSPHQKSKIRICRKVGFTM